MDEFEDEYEEFHEEDYLDENKQDDDARRYKEYALEKGTFSF